MTFPSRLMKKITRKVIAKAPSEGEVTPPKAGRPLDEKVEEVTGSPRGEAGRPKKVCSFCQSKTNPTYTDIALLRRYLTDRAKIVARAKNNLCSRHQRRTSEQIKYARHLALLPFVPKV